MQNEIGNQRLSANYLEKIEDELEAKPHEALFSSLEAEERVAAMERLRLATPQLLNAYRNRLLSGKDQRTIDPNFLDRLSEAAANKLDEDYYATNSQAAGLASKFRESLPILINAYRLEFGLPLRMR